MGQASVGNVTNPFMVTAAFTNFPAVEANFIRILVNGGSSDSRIAAHIDFLCAAQYLEGIAQQVGSKEPRR